MNVLLSVSCSFSGFPTLSHGALLSAAATEVRGLSQVDEAVNGRSVLSGDPKPKVGSKNSAMKQKDWSRSTFEAATCNPAGI